MSVNNSRDTERQTDVQSPQREETSGWKPSVSPGKVTLTSRLPGRSMRGLNVQRKANKAVQNADGAPAASAETSASVHETAAYGVVGAGSSLPHLDAIQQSFGHHDVSGVTAHVGGRAEDASQALGAEAYATGSDVAFRGQPSLHTAAHEAAHVVQQRAGVHLSGGVGQVGDAYEQHADAVADRVVRGHSAEAMLDQMAGKPARVSVQMSSSWGNTGRTTGASLWGRPGARTTQFFKDKKGEAGKAEAKEGGEEGAKDAAEAKRAADEAKKLAEFKKQTYSQKNHVPSTGYGAFDVEYVPMGGTLNITVRTDFQFKDSAKAKWANNTGLVGAVERVVNQAVWIAQYQAHIAKRWGGQYTMNCVKKYWDTLTANTNVNVVHDAANPHFRLKIVKMPPGKHNPNSAISIPGTWAYKNYKKQQPGFTPAWGGTLGGELGSTDPTELERSVSTASAKKFEPGRMRAHMPKQVLFADNKADVSAKDASKLKTFGTMLSMTRHPQLTVNLVGRASTSGDKAHNLDLSKRRSAAVAGAIRAGGNITHNLNQSAKGEDGAGGGAEWRRVDLSIDNLPKKWTNDYDVAGHEFGHQLGLDEEYNRGASGVVPDHFKLVEEAFGKQVASTFVRQDQDTASVMAAGLDVRPFHYVTFWEALGRVTSPTLSRADWKIQT